MDIEKIRKSFQDLAGELKQVVVGKDAQRVLDFIR